MNKTKENGITLISLAVTIIVLLILAGIVIISVMTDKGILLQANTASNEKQIQAYKEELTLCLMEAQLDSINNGKQPETEDYNNELRTTLRTKIEAKNNYYDLEEGTEDSLFESVTATKGGYKYKITTKTVEYIKDTGGNDIQQNSSIEEEEIVTEEDGVAQIGEKYYLTLQAAIDDVANNTKTTIILLKNTNELVTITAEKNIILNLNGKIVSNTNTVINNSGTINISGGTVISESNNTIENSGTITISGASTNISSNAVISSTNYSVINNTSTGNITINGGTFSSANCYVIDNSGTLNISSGNISSAQTKRDQSIVNRSTGTMTINGGTIDIKNKNAINNIGGNLIINGNAIVKSDIKTTILNQEKGTASISGGTISSTGGNVIYNTATMTISGTTTNISSTSTTNSTINNASTGTITINNGTIAAENYNTIDNNGILKINRATITSENRVAIKNNNSGASLEINETTTNILAKNISYPTIINSAGCTTRIRGGTIKSEKNRAINNFGTLNVGQNSATTNIEGNVGIWNNSEGNLTVTAGTIKGATYSIYNAGTASVSGATLTGNTHGL